MDDRRKAFIEFALECEVLRFGEFKLKSGRVSPYFFNAGLFDSGEKMARLGGFYADAIAESALDFDMLFGPAYKGIPLATGVAVAFAARHGRDLPFAFDRKEAKDHGEGGNTFGAPLAGRVLIVDDVISSGGSIAESVAIIRAAGAEPRGVVIALDREERGSGERSAVAEVQARYAIPVVHVIRLVDLIDYLAEHGTRAGDLTRIEAYRQRYGCA